MSGNLLPKLSNMIPDSLREEARASTARSRVFGHWETLQTMMLTATRKDKSLKNSVCLFYTAHEERNKLLEKELSELKESNRITAEQGTKKPGRPGTRERQLPKTKGQSISLNTAAYSVARKRLPEELTRELFTGSVIPDFRNIYSHFHGLKVYVVDRNILSIAGYAADQRGISDKKCE